MVCITVIFSFIMKEIAFLCHYVELAIVLIKSGFYSFSLKACFLEIGASIDGVEKKAFIFRFQCKYFEMTQPTK